MLGAVLAVGMYIFINFSVPFIDTAHSSVDTYEESTFVQLLNNDDVYYNLDFSIENSAVNDLSKDQNYSKITDNAFDILPKSLGKLILSLDCFDAVAVGLTNTDWSSKLWGSQPLTSLPLGFFLAGSQSGAIANNACYNGTTVEHREVEWKRLIRNIDAILNTSFGIYFNQVSQTYKAEISDAPLNTFLSGTSGTFGATHRNGSSTDMQIEDTHVDPFFKIKPYMRHLHLPHDVPCHENLSSVLALLPCLRLAGLASTLSGVMLANAKYMSIRLNVSRVINDHLNPEQQKRLIRFNVSVSFVLPSNRPGTNNIFTASSFSNKIASMPRCIVARKNLLFHRMVESLPTNSMRLESNGAGPNYRIDSYDLFDVISSIRNATKERRPDNSTLPYTYLLNPGSEAEIDKSKYHLIENINEVEVSRDEVQRSGYSPGSMKWRSVFFIKIQNNGNCPKLMKYYDFLPHFFRPLLHTTQLSLHTSNTYSTKRIKIFNSVDAITKFDIKWNFENEEYVMLEIPSFYLEPKTMFEMRIEIIKKVVPESRVWINPMRGFLVPTSILFFKPSEFYQRDLVNHEHSHTSIPEYKICPKLEDLKDSDVWNIVLPGHFISKPFVLDLTATFVIIAGSMISYFIVYGMIQKSTFKSDKITELENMTK